MEKRKGFTLIELLAVIVILAIIALIAMPIVLNMINNAKKKAAESSTYGFVDSIAYSNGLSDISEDYTKIPDGTYNNMEIFENLKMKGSRPTSGEVVIEHGIATSANICISGYKVKYENKKAQTIEKCGKESSPSLTTINADEASYDDTKMHLGCSDVDCAIRKLEDMYE